MKAVSDSLARRVGTVELSTALAGDRARGVINISDH